METTFPCRSILLSTIVLNGYCLGEASRDSTQKSFILPVTSSLCTLRSSVTHDFIGCYGTVHVQVHKNTCNPL